MSGVQPLRGSCSCGRYNYVVVIPDNAREQAQVHFRTDDDHRRSQGALLTAFLRVPLTWYTSNTTSFFPDETHNLISRTFTPTDEPHSQRKFCGYCGTHLSYWTEKPREEQEYVHITLGSLRNKDLDTLQDLELLPEDVTVHDADDSAVLTTAQPSDVRQTVRHATDGSMTWFEEMLGGSQIGRTRKTRRGAGTSADGTTVVSWEITEEYGNDEDSVMTTESRAKRKLEHDGE